MRLRHSLVLICAGLFLSVQVGLARADVEPNENIIEAEGPLAPGSYAGTLPTEQDFDWYWLQLGSQQQISMRMEVPKACDVIFNLADYYGEYIHEDEIEDDSEERTREYRYTTGPGGGTYYIYVRRGPFGCDPQGDEYTFSVAPATAYAPPPARPPIIPVPEPNEVEAQAFGPLQAGVLYSGMIETANDAEWMYFNVRSGRPFTVELTATCSDEIGGEVVATGEAPSGHPISAADNKRRSFSFEAPDRATKYYVKLATELAYSSFCPWQLEVSPPESLFNSFSGLRQAKRAQVCKSTTRALKRRVKKLQRAKRRLGYARHRESRSKANHKRLRRLKRSVRKKRRRVNRARYLVKRRCADL